MAGGPALGRSPVFESQLAALRDVQDRCRAWARPRHLRRLRGKGGIELERAGERVSAGASALLVMPILRVLLAAGLFSASQLEAQKVRVEVLPPPQNAWADSAPSISSAGLLTDPSM